MQIARSYLLGEKLYGDDFSLTEVQAWFKEEEYSYYQMRMKNQETNQELIYVYHAFNRYHAYNHIKGREFARCLAYGCAAGDDVLPIVDQVEKFIAVEPAEA